MRVYHADALATLVGVKLRVLGRDRNQTVADELVLVRLRALVQRVDQVPQRVQADARAVFRDRRGFAPVPLQDIDASDPDW